MTEPNDISVLVDLNCSDETQFNQLFNTYYQPLCFFCNGYIKDLDLARSLVQQVFVDLWLKQNKVRIKQNIKSYLYASVRNKSIDYLRHQKQFIHLTEKDKDIREVPFHDLIQQAETLEQINQSINQLPEKCKEIFLLCRFDGLKYKQIAHKLNISVKTVEMQMGIALKKLRSELGDNKSVNLFLCIMSKKK